MFCSYYGLTEQPFGVTPDTRFLYLTSTHREALASLFYAIESNRGFMVLVAEPGMGKTTLLMQLQQHFTKDASIAYVCQTQITSRELLRQVVSDFGVCSVSDNVAALYEQLNSHLIEQAKHKRKVLLIIDEAQDLESEVLESIRLLSNFETQRHKLLQIILVGQPLLSQKLASPGLVQLKQRIGTIAKLLALDQAESVGYIEHRLKCAGRTEKLFSDVAERMIACHSGGIPRNINHLCFNALSIAFARKLRIVDENCVREAIEDLDMKLLATSITRAQNVFGGLEDGCVAIHPRATKPDPVAWSMRVGIVASILLVTLFAYYIPNPRSLLARFGSSAAINRVQNSDPTHPSLALSPAPSAPESIRSATTDNDKRAGTKVRSDALVRATPQQTRSIHYTVRTGETVAEISKRLLGRYDLATLARIARVNPQLSDPNLIVAGQVLDLPEQTSTAGQRDIGPRKSAGNSSEESGNE